jgi:BlaI family penicillinase repressor
MLIKKAGNGGIQNNLYCLRNRLHSINHNKYQIKPTNNFVGTKKSVGLDMKSIEPTKSELEILSILWQHGPSPVRFVMQEINKNRELNYTATLKLMQLMADKGILKRDESKMQHIYQVVEEETKTKEHLLDKLIDTLYRGSATSLMLQLAGNKRTTKEDLKKMQELLAKMEKDLK